MLKHTKRKILLPLIITTFLVLSGCGVLYPGGNPAYVPTIPTTPELVEGPYLATCSDDETGTFNCIELPVGEWRTVMLWIMELKRELTAACIALGSSEED